MKADSSLPFWGSSYKAVEKNQLADSHLARLYYVDDLLSPKMAKLCDPISCCEMRAGIRVKVGTVKTGGVEAKMKNDKKNKIISCQPVSDLHQ